MQLYAHSAVHTYRWEMEVVMPFFKGDRLLKHIQ